jgi:hypothetical protein
VPQTLRLREDVFDDLHGQHTSESRVEALPFEVEAMVIFLPSHRGRGSYNHALGVCEQTTRAKFSSFAIRSRSGIGNHACVARFLRKRPAAYCARFVRLKP